jgi:hypothetical protein
VKKSLAKGSNCTSHHTVNIPLLRLSDYLPLPAPSSRSLALLSLHPEDSNRLNHAISQAIDINNELQAIGPVLQHVPSHQTNSTLLLLTEIDTLETQLPFAIPEAGPHDVLARFSQDPLDEASGYEEPYEMVNKALHQVFDYNADISQIVLLVCRGDLGVKGLVAWIRNCISTLKISPGLFEPRLEKLRDALHIL